MSLSTDRKDPFLARLVEFSKKAAASKPSRGWRRLFRADERQRFKETPVQESAPSPIQFSTGGAEPLSALKERDSKALADLFEREDLEEIHNDVLDCLVLLSPAPCWEEDAFDFLEGFV